MGAADCEPMYSPDDGTEGVTSGYFRNHEDCGQSPVLSRLMMDVSRIVGGEFPPTPGAWPWHAAIGPKSVGALCGGALINEEWILTAAHCVKLTVAHVIGTDLGEVFSSAPNLKPCQFNVRLGTPDDVYTPDQHTVDVTPSKIFYHSGFAFTSNADNDIALIKLEKAVVFTDHIKPVCLPGQEYTVTPGDVCYTMGYGENNIQTMEEMLSGPGERDDRFRQLQLEVVECGDTGTDPAQFVCLVSRERGQSPCRGDSGGSLVCRHGNRWYEAGIATSVQNCGVDPDTQMFYTRITHFLEWINSVISRN